MLASLFQKVKAYWEISREELFLITVIAAVALISFGLGRLSIVSSTRPAVRLLVPPAASAVGAVTAGQQEYIAGAGIQITGKNYVASKNGTKYYALWCGGVDRIKEENKIWFVSPAEAERAGYEKAVNCDL
ncbi:MAG: hypothetical protein HYU35_02640 [Parcubacteria group bacterium]|nr:hypothetical protein [Parcubacteria group bacterium]